MTRFGDLPAVWRCDISFVDVPEWSTLTSCLHRESEPLNGTLSDELRGVKNVTARLQVHARNINKMVDGVRITAPDGVNRCPQR